MLAAALAAVTLPGAQAAPRPVPSFDHVVVIVFENKVRGSVLGSRAAPTFNSLASRYAVLAGYRGVTHPSLPNYLALVSGSTQGITTDCTSCTTGGRSLADTLEAKGRTWKAYAEGLPRAGWTGAASGRYVKRHVPFLYFRRVLAQPARVRNVVPLTALSRDLAAKRLPDFALVVPDMCHNMHDCSGLDRGRLARALPAAAAAEPAARQQRGLRHLRRVRFGRPAGGGAGARPARAAGLGVRAGDVALRAAADDRGRLGPAAARALCARRPGHRHLALKSPLTRKRDLRAELEISPSWRCCRC